MKKYKFFALAFAAMTLGACSSDDVVDNGGGQGNVAPGEQGYVSLNINLPSQPSSRIAENFDNGTDEENAVKSAYLLLFGGSNEASATFQSAYKLETGSWNTSGLTSTSTKIVEPITKPVGDNMYAMVVLNGGGAITEGSNETTGWKFGGNDLTSKTTTFKNIYETALSLDLADVAGSTNGFLMTNAPLYTKAGGTTDPTGGSVQTLAPIDGELIYSSEADARNGQPAANVYVERAVAKVSVANAATPTSGSLTYTLEGFDLDVTNNKTYLVRNVDGADWWRFKNDNATGANAYRFVGGAAVGSGLYRTYWGKDPNYASSTADDLTKETTFTLSKDAQYCFENTFDVANMNQDVTTHVVIGAKLTVEGQDATSKDFYTIRGDKSTLYDNLSDISTIVQNDYFTNPVIADLIAKNKATGQEVSSADFDVTYDDATTGGYIKVKAITVKENSKSKFTNATAVENNANVIAAINSDLNIAYYKGGLSYYPVMIQHFGNTETPWTPTDGASEAYPGNDAAKNWLGRYGVLRNNSYQITVNGIKEIGSPEPPTSYPASEDDPVESWIGVSINILPWTVRAQSVDL